MIIIYDQIDPVLNMVVEIFSFFKNHDSGFFFFVWLSQESIHTHWLMTINHHHHSLNLFFTHFLHFTFLYLEFFFLPLCMGNGNFQTCWINQVKRTRFFFFILQICKNSFFGCFSFSLNSFSFIQFYRPVCVCVCGINLHGIYLFCKILDFFFFSLFLITCITFFLYK